MCFVNLFRPFRAPAPPRGAVAPPVPPGAPFVPFAPPARSPRSLRAPPASNAAHRSRISALSLRPSPRPAGATTGRPSRHTAFHPSSCPVGATIGRPPLLYRLFIPHPQFTPQAAFLTIRRGGKRQPRGETKKPPCDLQAAGRYCGAPRHQNRADTRRAYKCKPLFTGCAHE